MEETIEFFVNSEPVRLTVDGDRKLLWVLRSDLGLTGTKYGCGLGYCGACTVLMDGKPVRSCRTAVSKVAWKDIVTIEGLATDGILHPMQKAFMEHDALQCGYCTPGMILQAVGLLNRNPEPTRPEILDYMERNLCRCGAHTRIVRAIQSAARELSGVEDR